MTRELFPRYTGGTFDALTPAATLADHTLGALLTPERAARLVEQRMLDASQPGLEEVLGRVVEASFDAGANGAYEQEVQRVVESVVVDRLEALAARAPMPQVRAISMSVLRGVRERLELRPDTPHSALLAMEIGRFLERPTEPVESPEVPAAPPGAPIGAPAFDWIH